MERQIKVVLVGAGDRADVYATYALKHPEKMKVVGIVEPDVMRRNLMKKKYSVPQEYCYENVNEFIKEDLFADAVINGTMDQLHVETSIPILQKGYDLLLEKPFAVNEDEMKKLFEVAKGSKRKVYICHVLRYTPFYSAIKKHIMEGEIGDVISIEMCEHVRCSHMGVSYVRGKWRSEKTCYAPMLLAKSCHDIDLMMWMLGDTVPVSVASFGSDYQFTPDKKPKGAGTRCMKDCPYNSDCRFSAEAHYITEDRWKQYTWKELENEKEPTLEEKIESLKTTNPYGKCVWDCERDGNVDHQTVIVNFKNGATGSFTMTGGSAKSERNIHIVGTKGEIKGTFETSKYVVRHILPYTHDEYDEVEYDLKITGDMVGQFGSHGGGDERLIEDFVDSLLGKEPSISCTSIENSMISHLVVFRAEKSRKNKQIEFID